jgi:hypothetical protein
MKRYWTRITLGALGIFALGMVVVRAGRQGVEHIKQHVMHQTVRLDGHVAPFQVDNRRLGMLTEVQMDPERSEQFPFVNLTVLLDSSLGTANLGDCVLLARDLESLDSENGLHCAVGVSRDSLVQMGMVTFEPSEETVGIYLPASDLEAIPFFRNAGRRSNLPDKGQGGLNLQADASGAFMLIKDEKGRPIFQMNADSGGAFIQIRDTNGKEVMRFRADSQGVVARMDSN